MTEGCFLSLGKDYDCAEDLLDLSYVSSKKDSLRVISLWDVFLSVS